MTIKELAEKQVILCKTQKEAERILEMAHKEGFAWNYGASFLSETSWSTYQNTTCYDILKGQYCNVKFYEGNHDILDSSLFHSNPVSSLLIF